LQVRRELADLKNKLQPLQMRYQQEKKRLDELHTLQKKKEDLQVKLEQAENRMDLAMVADIKYVLHTPAESPIILFFWLDSA
jgi:ATP-dependent Clp protease ATP-binding subunit ClpB